jgi:hypothetical protein
MAGRKRDAAMFRAAMPCLDKQKRRNEREKASKRRCREERIEAYWAVYSS